MSNTTRLTAWLALTGVLLVTGFASSTANANLIPGINDPGKPQFLNTVKLQVNTNGSWTARLNNGDKDLSFNDGIKIWTGQAHKYNFSASFDKDSGVFTGGTVSIQGSLPGLEIFDKKTVLMSGDLISFGYAGNLVGFNTTNLFCNSMLGVACGTDESVIFSLNTLFSGDTLARLNTTATAITTIPLPAAVWLLGSGLLGLVGIARRGKAAV